MSETAKSLITFLYLDQKLFFHFDVARSHLIFHRYHKNKFLIKTLSLKQHTGIVFKFCGLKFVVYYSDITVNL